MNVLSPAEPPVNRREILRYAGCRGGGAEGLPLEECLRLSAGVLSYRVVWETFPVSAQEDTVDLGFARVRSAALARSLAGCGSALVFAASRNGDMFEGAIGSTLYIDKVRIICTHDE